MKYHNTLVRNSDGTSVEAIFIQATLSSKTLTPYFYDLILQEMCQEEVAW